MKARMTAMSEYYNLIQLMSGAAAVILIFLGIFLTIRQLNPEKYETIPVKSTIICTILIAAGLLFYAVVKTCTNLTVVTEEHYELTTVYLVSLGEVIKIFGFTVFIPLIFKLFKPRSRKPEKDAEDQLEETE